MKTTLKAVGVASSLVVAALVGGTLISVVSASPAATGTTGSPSAIGNADRGAYCDLWLQTFADELGISVDNLTPAAKAAAIATIDQAVANGDLPSDIGDRMKARIDAADGDGCRLLGAGFRALGGHAIRSDFRIDWVSAASEALNLQPAELVSDLRGGDSLQEIADAQGVEYAAVSRAILDAAKTDLDALVSAGTITQEQADQHLANLSDRLDSGEFPPHRGAGHGRPGGIGNGPARDGSQSGLGARAFGS